ncbi:MAG: DUF6029 family protein, partial [Bacteroidota bacterium]
MKRKMLFTLLAVVLLSAGFLFAQEPTGGQIHGNFQTDFQYYIEDSIIGAGVPDEKMGLNSYANFTYTKGNFNACIRYEGYFPPLNGFDQRYEGVGIPYKFAQYSADNIDITVGNFYEQFGSGLVLRAYEEKNLGYDNAFEGVKVKVNPLNGLYIKGLIGKQRAFWDKSDGVVRGVDGEVNFNELIEKYSGSKAIVTLGGSFVSKYQADLDPIYIYPENVAAYAGRGNITYGKINLYSEYAYKMNDPSADNGKIYKPGEALLVNASFSQKGFGAYISAKRVDNMSYRSDRDASLAKLNINYIPDITKAHTYSLAAMYPYATQLNGEVGFQGEVSFKFKKNSTLGGKYGTGLNINFSRVNSIDRQQINDTVPIGTPATDGYVSDFFTLGDELFFQDLNIEINKKISDKLKGVFIYQNLIYNNDVIHGAGKWHGMIYANVVIVDATYKLKKTIAIRGEFQGLFTEQQYGDWASGLFEFTIPHLFFTVMNQYNYGNPYSELRVLYPYISCGFV